MAVYRVLEPHLVSTYVYHADATDPLADTPTVRLLRQLAALGQSHVAWGQAVLEIAGARPREPPPHHEVQAEIEAQLVEFGGVTGQGIEATGWPFTARARPTSPSRASAAAGAATASPSSARRCSTRWSKRRSGSPTTRTTSSRRTPAADEWSLEGFRHKFHQLLYGEVETTDRMGKMLAEFPDLPWEMRMELAHQMWDEARHIEIVAKACEEELGATLGYGPWTLVWWWMQNEPRPAAPHDRDQQLGRGQPDAHCCASGASTPRRAASTASPSCATTCRPTS